MKTNINLYLLQVVPLHKGTLTLLEKCNTAVGRFILQIPRGSANIASYIDAGLKPVRSVVAERVLIYAHNTMHKPEHNWASVAMKEHFANGAASSYAKYLLDFRISTGSCLSSVAHIKSRVKSSTISHILAEKKSVMKSTIAISGPEPSLTKNGWFQKKPWVSDNSYSRVFASFRVMHTGLGNRGPLSNGKTYKLCPLCDSQGIRAPNNEVKRIIRFS